jgi:periplasmic divalent cation tolerance protein
MSAIVVLCTCPNADSAERIAHTLVEERLAACVNRVPGIRSTYRWQGQITTDIEELLIIKTTRERFESLRERILALHGYSVPEIVAVEISAGHAPYLAWIAASVG